MTPPSITYPHQTINRSDAGHCGLGVFLGWHLNKNLIHEKRFKDYFFGRWWDKDSEADIVGIDKQNKKLLVGEVKFKNLNKSEIIEIKNSLIEKAKKINSFNFEQKLVIVCLGCDFEDKDLEIIKLSNHAL